jgi:hypothetical protein
MALRGRRACADTKILRPPPPTPPPSRLPVATVGLLAAQRDDEATAAGPCDEHTVVALKRITKRNKKHESGLDISEYGRPPLAHCFLRATWHLSPLCLLRQRLPLHADVCTRVLLLLELFYKHAYMVFRTAIFTQQQLLMLACAHAAHASMLYARSFAMGQPGT